MFLRIPNFSMQMDIKPIMMILMSHQHVLIHIRRVAKFPLRNSAPVKPCVLLSQHTAFTFNQATLVSGCFWKCTILLLIM